MRKGKNDRKGKEGIPWRPSKLSDEENEEKRKIRSEERTNDGD
jgi:hypothetical protein